MSAPKKGKGTVHIHYVFARTAEEARPGQLTLEWAKKHLKPYRKPGPLEPRGDGQQGTSGSAPSGDGSP